MVAHTLAALAAVPRLAARRRWRPTMRSSTRPCPFEGERGWVARCGATRAETVANGLAVLRERGAQPHDWMLVHDAARCLIRPEWVERLIDECMADEVGGLLALPVADTLKAQGRDTRVASTIDRGGKWAAQTPQMFRLGLLARWRMPARRDDESSAIEALGHEPKLVRGEWENLKLTWQAICAASACWPPEPHDESDPTPANLPVGIGEAGTPRPGLAARWCWAG
jgi:2-C-methyl-D-erythritol 4-phosphate cytidylyltransferase